MLSEILIKANALLMKVRRAKCRPEELLILIPSCLQNSKCERRVSVDVANCRRCGGCAVGELNALAEECGAGIACAAGGRLALALVKDRKVKAVVAVACEKELRAGLVGAFPKPVLTIRNLRPHGPCRDTGVDLAEVRRAVEAMTRAGRGQKRQKE